MEVLWRLKEAKVSEIISTLNLKPEPAYTTVLTLLRILEKKGCVGHTKDGKAHVFYPLILQSEARRDALKFVLDRFFGNSPKLLMQNLIQDTELNKAELEQLRVWVQEAGSDHD